MNANSPKNSGEHTKVNATMLSGVRVVEAATYAAAPTAGSILADHGADVIHIEDPRTGDPYRTGVAQVRVTSKDDEQFNSAWELVNRNKRSLELSLKTKEGREAFDRLIAGSDVFITNMLPKRREQLGTTYERLKGINPKLVYVGITGYGDVGPLKDERGFDLSAYWAGSGLMEMFGGVAGGVPPMCRSGMGDRALGLVAAGAVGLALYHRERTGVGQEISLSLMHLGMWQAGLDIQRTAALGAPAPMEPRTAPSNPILNSYQCSDGRWLVIILWHSFESWKRLVETLGRPELADEQRFSTPALRRDNSAEVVATLEKIFATRTQAEWLERLRAANLICSPVLSPQEVVNGEQAKAINAFFDAEHADIGRYRLLRSPLNFSATPAAFRHPAPALGDGNQDILKELGYDEAQIAAILAAQSQGGASAE